MKNFIYIFLLVQITTVDIDSQEINPLDFFPHHVGDVWQYLKYPSGSFREVNISRIDTIDSNTLLLYYGSNNSPSVKILIDSAFVLADPITWFQWYKLSYPAGSIWIRDTTTSWWVYFKSEKESLIFNENRKIREYYIYEFSTPGDTNNLPGLVEYLVAGIGIYKYTWEGGEESLIGCIINGTQYGTIISVEDQNFDPQPTEYILNNFPNPFNGQTTIYYYVPSSDVISIDVYDVLGRAVKKIFEGYKTAGSHYCIWEPYNQSSGIYFIVMRTKNTQLTHKVLLLK